jgi:hypothetical protein
MIRLQPVFDGQDTERFCLEVTFHICARKVLASKLGWSKEHPGSISHGVTQYFQANVRMQHKFPPRSLPCIRLAPCYTTSFIELLDPAKPNLLMESLNKLQMATYMEMLLGPVLTSFIQSCLLDALTEDKHAGRT